MPVGSPQDLLGKAQLSATLEGARAVVNLQQRANQKEVVLTERYTVIGRRVASKPEHEAKVSTMAGMVGWKKYIPVPCGNARAVQGSEKKGDGVSIMTDLTYCYLHMTRNDLLIIDTVDTTEYMKGDLSDEELDIPSHLIPPNPDDSDSMALPSQVHPSYPYGNPTNSKHPAAKPRPPYDPSSRALFEDMGYGGGGINGSLRWRDLGLNDLLPVDEEKEEAKRAMQARKMASGTSNNHPQAHQAHHAPQVPQGQLGDGDEDEDEDEDDEENNDDLDGNDDDDDDDEESEVEGEE